MIECWGTIEGIMLLRFFFNDTATTEIYTLSLHDALPIYGPGRAGVRAARLGHRGRGDPMLAGQVRRGVLAPGHGHPDRKSTRLNSSHANISYAVFCLKKKNRNYNLSYIYYLSNKHLPST